jgi:hypothetical protein
MAPVPCPLNNQKATGNRMGFVVASDCPSVTSGMLDLVLLNFGFKLLAEFLAVGRIGALL